MPCLANPRRRGGAGRRCWSRCAREPGRAAILTDVDGTLAPIVERRRGSGGAGGGARGAGGAERALRAWSAASPAGRPRRRGGWSASTALAYAGNHGLELLLPGERGAAARPLAGRARGARRPSSSPALDAATLDGGRAAAARTRGRSRRCTGAAPRTRRRPRRRAHEIAVEAGRAGLEPRWGRKVLELRPVGRRRQGRRGRLAARRRAARPRRLRRRRPHRPRRLPPPARAARGGRAERGGLRRRALAGGAGGAGRGVRPDRRRARRAGWRSSSGWRQLSADALHRPAPRHRLPHRRRGDRAGGDHRAGGQPRRRHDDRSSSPPPGGWSRWRSASTSAARARAADDVRDALARARTATSLPDRDARPGSPSAASGRSPSPRSPPASSASSSPASPRSAPATP